MSSEKRKFIRADKMLGIQYGIASGQGGEILFKKAETLNISAGGMKLAVPEYIAEGQEVVLQFILPAQNNYRQLRVLSVITRAGSLEKAETPCTFYVGVKFLNIREKELETINRFVTRSLLSKTIISEEKALAGKKKQLSLDHGRADVYRRNVLGTPLHQFIGLEINSIGEGEAELSVAVNSKTQNLLDCLHGGIFYLVSDVTAFMSLGPSLAFNEFPVTIDIQCSLYKGISSGQAVFRGRVSSCTPHLAFINVEVTGDNGELLAETRVTASIINRIPGTFINRMSKK